MQRRYQHTWESLPYLDADYMARWPAFVAGFTESIEFDDEGMRSAAFAMDADHDCFTIEYVDPHHSTADPLWSCIAIQRRPCRFGGEHIYFIAPGCERATLRLALLPSGVKCGICGNITYQSRRETPVKRMIRRARDISDRLGCADWKTEPAKRRRYMRRKTYNRLRSQRGALVAEINGFMSGEPLSGTG
ncbi:MAG: hypothetical protein ACR2PG_02435 [Hyphomicrobiaceae bacterium]